MWSAVVRPVGHTAKFSNMTLEVGYGREMNIQLSGNRSGAVSMPIAPYLNLRHLWHFVVTQLHILVAFYCPQHNVHLYDDHAVQSAS